MTVRSRLGGAVKWRCIRLALRELRGSWVYCTGARGLERVECSACHLHRARARAAPVRFS